MYRILCYGDSNTWGWDPSTQSRYPDDVRWTGVLQAELGANYRVLEEGLNGRTTVWDDPIEEHRCGKDQLYPTLDSQAPLDLVVLMLGTNDLKHRFSVTAADVGESVRLLLDIIGRSTAGRDDNPPPVLLVCPPPVADNLAETEFGEIFLGALEKSLLLGSHYALVAEEHGAAFLDAGQVITSSRIDAIHFDAPEHGKLGRAIAAKVRQIIE